MTRLQVILLYAFMFQTGFVFAQARTVSGVVRAEDDTKLPGVNVQEKGTTNGTSSDAEGRYTLSVSDGATLVFSFIGMVTQELPTSGVESLDVTMKEDAIYCGPALNIGYGYAESREITGAAIYQSDADFNRGNIFDATRLWQGRVAGLSIYNRGGDPHTESILRIRGMNSFDVGASPLIVVDGMPMATLGNVDPHDIASITVLKDGASAAIYGMRGSQGVIIVTTKSGSPGRGMSVSFQTESAASAMAKHQPVLSASEYIAIGGNDQGAVTNWYDEITRTALSQNHHLVVSSANRHSSFRVATHVRSVEGILKKSGFDQINTRVNVKHNELDDRLRFNFNLAVTNRDNDFSFTDAFRYAVSYSPTAPIRFPNGSFFEAILFDNYNPVALLEQNINQGKRRNLSYNAMVNFDFTNTLTATVNTGQQFAGNSTGRYYSREAFYFGLNRGGLAQRYTDDSENTFIETYLTYRKTSDKISFEVVGGYSFQKDQTESFGAQLGNFPSDELGYNALEYSGDMVSGMPNLISIYSNSSPTNRIAAGFARARVNIGRAIVLNSSARYEGSSKLGTNEKTGLFLSGGINVNLLHYFQNSNFKQWNVRLGYGTTGAIPSQSGLSTDLYRYTQTNGGSTYKVQDANPDLKHERKKELNLGFDFSVGRFFGSLDVYQRRTTDLIRQQYVDQTKYPSGIRNENVATLKGRGVEATLSYHAGAVGDLQWTPFLVVSGNRTIVEKYPGQQQLHGYMDGPAAGGSTQMIRTAVGEKVGQMWSPVFDGVDANGGPRLKDQNGDGLFFTNPGDASSPQTDFTDVGYAFPVWELGWGNQLSFRQWKLSAFFRGAFGHSLVNAARISYEPVNPGLYTTMNLIRTKKAVDGLTWGRYHSLYVERADFLMLDNISLEYTVPLKPERKLHALRIFTTVQRAFTITGYTGPDPEPVLVERSFQTPVFSVSSDALAPGIDRNALYMPARTFMLGVSVGF